ncbi:hypothetical protein FRC10_010465 [Ceratobasidium sp. 414]|nr:hypothetical protein FRC10_010465 [Ceratobasidium sp. 414]
MPSLPLSLIHNPKPTRTSSQRPNSQPTPSHHALAIATSELPTELRHSQRACQPSAHKLESDEYQASSRGSSRPQSPSELGHKQKSKKRPNGKRGARPGQIIQPASDTGSEAYESSPEPFAPTGSQRGDSFLAPQGPSGGALKKIGHAEAIRCTTAYLGSDASDLPPKTLQQIFSKIVDEVEGVGSGPMEVEKGGTSGRQNRNQLDEWSWAVDTSHTPEELPVCTHTELKLLKLIFNTIDAIKSVQGPGQLTGCSHNPSEMSCLEALPNSDTATVSESELECTEIAPSNSVSCVLCVSPSPHPLTPLFPSSPSLGSPSLGSLSLGSPSPDPLRYPSCPPPAPIPDDVNKSEPPNDDSDTATDDELDSESELETARSLKRCRLTPYLRGSRSPRHHAAVFHPDLNKTPHRHLPSRPTVSQSSMHTLPVSRPAPTISNHRQSTSTLTAPRLALCSSLNPSQPPPLSDIDAVLAWAAWLAQQATHMPTSRGTGTSSHPTRAGQLEHPLGLLTQVASTPGVQGPRSHRQRARSVDSDNAAALEAEEAALALGKHLCQRHKPTLDDFPGFRQHIATLAIPKLIATTVAKGAYEVHKELSDMATRCYNSSWASELPDIPLQKAPPPLAGIDPYIDTNQYENPALARCIACIFFWAPESIGMVFHDKFYPIPLPTIAMALTTMQHCISEWKTGRFIKRDLNIKKQHKMYQSHLKGLLEYAKPASKRLKDFQKEWFWYSVDYAGASIENDDAPYQSITRADRVRPDTPEPGTNANFNSNHHSHTSANADGHRRSSGKGKGRDTLYILIDAPALYNPPLLVPLFSLIPCPPPLSLLTTSHRLLNGRAFMLALSPLFPAMIFSFHVVCPIKVPHSICMTFSLYLVILEPTLDTTLRY